MPEKTPPEEIDVLIVGSGPSGTSTALHLVQNDPTWADRMLVVDKAIHPREKLCGGGVTHLGENVLSDLGLSFDEIPNFEIREVRITYRKLAYSFRGNPVFRIIHRALFDHWLVQKAEAQGVEIRQGEAVLDVIEHDDYIEVISDQRTYRAKTLIAADGSRSLIRRKLNWPSPSRVSRLIEVLTPETRDSSWEFRDGVAVFDFTRMTSHQLQGYYWDFPSMVGGEMKMNRGVFDSRTRTEREKADLKATLKDSMAERERELNPKEIKGHPIRWLHWRDKFSKPRILLAGDAAGADPLFGEGIGPALAYGKVAAAAVADAFARNQFSYRSYKRRLFLDGVIFSVVWRTALAQIVYRVYNPRMIQIGWRIADRIIRLTPWNRPDFVPARKPK